MIVLRLVHQIVAKQWLMAAQVVGYTVRCDFHISFQLAVVLLAVRPSQLAPWRAAEIGHVQPQKTGKNASEFQPALRGQGGDDELFTEQPVCGRAFWMSLA